MAGIAASAGFTTGLRISMAIGATAYLTAATLALFCIPRPRPSRAAGGAGPGARGGVHA